VLGPSPPWSGYNCVSVDTRQTTTTLTSGASGTLTATCPFATRAVGGGMWLMQLAGPHGVEEHHERQRVADHRQERGQLERQLLGVGRVFDRRAGQHTGQHDPGQRGLDQPEQLQHLERLVRHGHPGRWRLHDHARIDNNARSSSTGNTWQVSAFNTTGTAKSLTAFAYCLPSTGLTYSQASVGIGPGGLGFVLCSPKKVLGGGFSFPRTSNYQVNGMQAIDSTTYLVTMTSVPSGGDPNAKAYAECLTHP
jgi:hypothetical protein